MIPIDWIGSIVVFQHKDLKIPINLTKTVQIAARSISINLDRFLSEFYSKYFSLNAITCLMSKMFKFLKSISAKKHVDYILYGRNASVF